MAKLSMNEVVKKVSEIASAEKLSPEFMAAVKNVSDNADQRIAIAFYAGYALGADDEREDEEKARAAENKN